MNEELELMPLPLAKDQQSQPLALESGQPQGALADELVLEAKRQVTIRCGKSSITLYPNGKIALRGDYILSDAEGINRIVGSQIELN